uniref:Uncharacterized protein n=1 Tax=uncultured Thiotrichaceae bacterium TaxID=298394 RepID=A0A6S6TZ66_9GAMM|nr:MAG: Unknown protein [uncultured Thiotrichaceae bacterium]
MNESILLLLGVNVLVLALLMLVLLFSRLHWVLRLLLVLIVSGSYWVAYQGWDRAQGWPSSNAMPEKFLLHGAVIEEPDPEKGVSGTIFIWATDLSTHQPAEQPRAFVMPYSKKLHGATQEALRHMRNGELQLGTVLPDIAAKQIGDGFAGEVPTLIEFSNLPKQALPEK